MHKFKLRLRFFDEEVASQGVDAAASVGDATNNEQTGVTEEAPAKMSFKDLIKSPEYKEEADKHIQGLLNKRFKGYKDQEAMMAKQNKILNVVRAKYGITDENDLEGLLSKVQNDDSYYEEKALEEGLTVDQYKRFAQAEAKNREYEAEAERQRMETQTQKRVAEWQTQAAEMKQKYPDFNLSTLLENDRFNELLRRGFPMENAYFAIEGVNMLQGAMERTASAVREAAASDIRSNGNRPRENATGGRASASVRPDVAKLTRADREDLSRRALAGEIISFS